MESQNPEIKMKWYIRKYFFNTLIFFLVEDFNISNRFYKIQNLYLCPVFPVIIHWTYTLLSHWRVQNVACPNRSQYVITSRLRPILAYDFKVVPTRQTSSFLFSQTILDFWKKNFIEYLKPCRKFIDVINTCTDLHSLVTHCSTRHYLQLSSLLTFYFYYEVVLIFQGNRL